MFIAFTNSFPYIVRWRKWNKNYWLFKCPSLWIGKASEEIYVTMEHAQYDRFNESNI